MKYWTSGPLLQRHGDREALARGATEPRSVAAGVIAVSLALNLAFGPFAVTPAGASIPTTCVYDGGTGVASPPPKPASWNLRPEQLYIAAVYQLFVKRSPSPSDVTRWTPYVLDGSRRKVTNSLAVTDEWAGVRVNALYQKVLGRDADPGGREHWVSKIRAGHRLEDVAALMFSSSEYWRKNGATYPGYVNGLYRDILGRSADSAGRTNWVNALQSRRMGRATVAARFYASAESRRDRVTQLYQEILGRSPDPGGLSNWMTQLLRIGDVRLASYLASSTEYYQRVTR